MLGRTECFGIFQNVDFSPLPQNVDFSPLPPETAGDFSLLEVKITEVLLIEFVTLRLVHTGPLAFHQLQFRIFLFWSVPWMFLLQ